MSYRCNDNISPDRYKYNKLDAIDTRGNDLCQLATSQSDCGRKCDSNSKCGGYLYFTSDEFDKLAPSDKQWVTSNDICKDLADDKGCCYLKSSLNPIKAPKDWDGPVGLVYQKGDEAHDFPTWVIIIIVSVVVVLVLVLTSVLHRNKNKNTRTTSNDNTEKEMSNIVNNNELKI